MSMEANTQLLNRAHEALENVLGTVREGEILRAIENSDLDELERLVTEVELRMYQEDVPFDVMTDERAEAMYKEQNDVY